MASLYNIIIVMRTGCCFDEPSCPLIVVVVVGKRWKVSRAWRTEHQGEWWIFSSSAALWLSRCRTGFHALTRYVVATNTFTRTCTPDADTFILNFALFFRRTVRFVLFFFWHTLLVGNNRNNICCDSYSVLVTVHTDTRPRAET